MASEEESRFDDSPIITYSNRIQKHMFTLTEQLGAGNLIGHAEKRNLRLLIANLPPEGKEKLKNIYALCETDEQLTMTAFDRMYGQVSDWIYKNILQDAFKAKPKQGRGNF
jgi:hypothetical protein